MIYTFYSFKGGVGRSMALANIGELLCQRGLDVLLVDFDLEAPGLDRFLREAPDDVLERRGLIDMVLSYKALRALPRNRESGQMSPVEPLDHFITPIASGTDSRRGKLYLLTAGQRPNGNHDSFAEKVRRLDWDDFYVNCEGEAFFDWFRREAVKYADVVLVDSRTGISEMSGICTYHLADAVVMLVAPNVQNVLGTISVARHLRDQRESMNILLVPSRVDRTESALLVKFKTQFMAAIGEFGTSGGLQFENDHFDDLKIPYVARYAYYETIAASEPDQPVAADLVGAYNRLLAAMVELAPKDGAFFSHFYQRTRASTVLGSGGRVPELPEHFVERRWVFEALEAWLEKDSPRVFFLAGSAGTGKTVLAAHLLQISEGKAQSPGLRQLVPGLLTYAHFSSGIAPSSLDPRSFVASFASALANQFPDVAEHIAGLHHPGIAVEIRRSISATAAGSRVSLAVQSIEIGAVDIESACARLIIEPLLQRGSGDSAEPVLLVDGLDEAGTRRDQDSLIRLLLTMVTQLQTKVRFILCGRPVPELMMGALGGAEVVNLDESRARVDIGELVAKHFAAIVKTPDTRTFDLGRRIVDLGAGNFRWTSYCFDGVSERQLSFDDRAWEPALGGLYLFYRQALAREIGPEPEAWSGHARLLGAVILARGDGLKDSHLAGILGLTRHAFAEAVRPWMRYLRRSSDKALSPFHESFRTYLLQEERYPIPVSDIHVAIAGYFLREYSRDWTRCHDEYALRHTPGHLLGAIDAALNHQNRVESEEKLIALLTDEAFLRAKAALAGWQSVVDDLRVAPPTSAILGNLGLFYLEGGQTNQAVESYERAVEKAREQRERQSEAVLLANLGQVHARLDRPEEAIACWQRALLISEELGDIHTTGGLLGSIGLAFISLEKPHQALEVLQTALRLAVEQGNDRDRCNLLGLLGNCYWVMGDFDLAALHHEHALAVARENLDHSAEGVWLTNLALGVASRGDFARAKELGQQAVAVTLRAREPASTCRVLIKLAYICLDASAPDEAHIHLREGLAVARSLADPLLEGDCLTALGDVGKHEGKLDDARQLYQAAIDVFSRSGQPFRNNALKAKLRELEEEPGARWGPNLAAETRWSDNLESTMVGHNALEIVTQGVSEREVEAFVRPLETALVKLSPPEQRMEALSKTEVLKSELSRGSRLDDTALATVMDALITMVPAVAVLIVSGIGGMPAIAALLGPVTKFVLQKMASQVGAQSEVVPRQVAAVVVEEVQRDES